MASARGLHPWAFLIFTGALWARSSRAHSEGALETSTVKWSREHARRFGAGGPAPPVSLVEARVLQYQLFFITGVPTDVISGASADLV